MTENKELDPEEKSAEVLRVARERFDLAVEAESAIRLEALDDLKFSAGEQWPDEVKRSREIDKRPCLTINRIPQSVHQITNDQRQNRPSIKVSPVDDKADVETAKIYQGIIRHIEDASNADTAYDTALDSSVRAGFGYYRIVTEYCDPLSFDLEARIKRVPDRFSVYLDPSYQEPDGSDAEWGFIFEDVSKETYKAHYPNSKMASMDDWASIGDKRVGWATSSTVRVAEYFYKDYRETTLVQLSNKQVVEKHELPDELRDDLEIIAERKTLVPQIKWCKINAIEVLEETIWPGKWIPIIPVLGEEQVIEGKRILSGIVRYAKDPQRMYNYWASAETETIALAPRAPWIGAEGQFEGHEEKWQTANIKNHAYLEFVPKSLNGVPLGPPMRNAFEPPVQAISNARMLASEDLKATTGIYDAALGARSNENSGIAIHRRNVQAQTSNFHYVDNLSKSIRHGGRILVDIIPHIYDTDRAVRILGEDGQEEIVRINQLFERNGKPVRYDLGVGKYDVSINTGPSFETKRQEAVASMADMSRSNPQLMQIAGDLMVKNMDWPGAQEIAERLRKTLPPGIAEEKGKTPLPPDVQQKMNQMGEMIDRLTAELQEKTKIVETKVLELESRERIEMAKLQAEIEVQLAKMGSQESQFLLKNEIAEIQERLNLLNINQPIQTYTDAGPTMAAPPEQQPQPTGGEAPGQPMGENHDNPY